MTHRPDHTLELIRRILGTGYLDLPMVRLSYEEDFASGNSRVRIDTGASGSSPAQSVDGTGVGLVDALMNGLLARYAQEYSSLGRIEVAAFTVKADIETKEIHAGSDAEAEVVLLMRNSEGKIIQFSDASRSVVASAARATLAAIEYFVNAERAFILLQKALQDAKERGRADLVARFTRELAEVVQSTNYSQLIDQDV